MPSSNSVIVPGSKLAALSAASFMAKQEWNVTVIEKPIPFKNRSRLL
jgi:monoamine oxidase